MVWHLHAFHFFFWLVLKWRNDFFWATKKVLFSKRSTLWNFFTQRFSNWFRWNILFLRNYSAYETRLSVSQNKIHFSWQSFHRACRLLSIFWACVHMYISNELQTFNNPVSPKIHCKTIPLLFDVFNYKIEQPNYCKLCKQIVREPVRVVNGRNQELRVKISTAMNPLLIEKVFFICLEKLTVENRVHLCAAHMDETRGEIYCTNCHRMFITLLMSFISEFMNISLLNMTIVNESASAFKSWNNSPPSTSLLNSE